MIGLAEPWEALMEPWHLGFSETLSEVGVCGLGRGSQVFQEPDCKKAANDCYSLSTLKVCVCVCVWQASHPQGSSCLHRPRAGIIAHCRYVCLLKHDF